MYLFHAVWRAKEVVFWGVACGVELSLTLNIWVCIERRAYKKLYKFAD